MTTSPSPIPPHQDPAINHDPSRVTMLEYVTTLIAQLDRRFETLLQELKESVLRRFAAEKDLHAAADLRYQQRFDAQAEALKAAFAAQDAATKAALAAADKAVIAAMTAAEKAVAKAEAASEKRFDSVNEFRAQLADQAATFIPRIEAEQRIQALAEKVDILRQAASIGTGHSAGLSAGWSYLIGAVGLAAAVIGIIVGTR